MAGQREELYSLKGATVPYRYAHPDIQLLLINNYFIETSSVEYRVLTTLRNVTVTNIKVSSINIDMTIDDMPICQRGARRRALHCHQIYDPVKHLRC
eukprot:scaffold120008_cov73-Phaeocystis_antarctica.AAC.1